MRSAPDMKTNAKFSKDVVQRAKPRTVTDAIISAYREQFREMGGGCSTRCRHKVVLVCGECCLQVEVHQRRHRSTHKTKEKQIAGVDDFIRVSY